LKILMNESGFFKAFFWVISRRLNFIWRRFGTLCLFHLYNTPTFSNPVIIQTYLPMKNEQTVYSEMSAYKNSDAGELPRRKHTTFRTGQKFVIKSQDFLPTNVS